MESVSCYRCDWIGPETSCRLEMGRRMAHSLDMRLYHSVKWQKIHSWNGNLQYGIDLLHRSCLSGMYTWLLPFIPRRCSRHGQHRLSPGATISVNKTQDGVRGLNPAMNDQHVISFNEPYVCFDTNAQQQRHKHAAPLAFSVLSFLIEWTRIGKNAWRHSCPSTEPNLYLNTRSSLKKGYYDKGRLITT